jgi:hypothetical protein
MWFIGLYLPFFHFKSTGFTVECGAKKGPHLDETMSIGCQNLRIVELRGKIMGFQSNKNGDL